MAWWVHTINVATHAPAFYFLTRIKSFDLPFILLMLSTISSCLMHLSETKHNLSGVFGLGRYSQMCLNADRIFAVLLAVTIALHTHTWSTFNYAIAFFVLSIITALGELTNNWFYYTALHSIWHLGVFYMAGSILMTASTFGLKDQRYVWQVAPI